MPAPSPYAARLARTPVAQSELEVLGGRTRYWTYGSDDAEATVVLVHGFRGDHHGLEPVVAQLEGIRLIAPDLPGFGESTPLPGRVHDLGAYTDWLSAFVDRLALHDRPVILGHSFGSIVTAHAVAEGLATPKLVLVNPIAAPALRGPKALLTALTVLYYRLGAALPAGAGESLLRSPLIVRAMSVAMARTSDASLRRWIHEEHDRFFSAFSDRGVLLDAFRASVSNDVSDVAARLYLPTLLIAAERDQITAVPAQRSLAERMPDARLVVLPDVGHLIHYEVPRLAAQHLVDFLGAGRVAR